MLKISAVNLIGNPEIPIHYTSLGQVEQALLSKRNEIYLLSKSPKILWKCKKLFLEHYQFSISKQNPRLLFHLFSVKKGVMTFWTIFGDSGYCERPSQVIIMTKTSLMSASHRAKCPPKLLVFLLKIVCLANL